ncbi:septal ring lytic transglycosylase RlpA family protein [Oceanidesulfovibrio marinus]|uniref:Probable endolytic peptidoglycan transglycosylase RlpA n=1 Tax=Oceanidesulfovibrio marinus TaxID=370038 RepID=A0A6P1ZKK1_9BACT|nr:septal ring lytic transglycosylase RlpA family protein [Oceanidesulfovibrio marinus]TVM36113.1 septal ring lytic transglycosylase RlpA family lipoprotein [Oceanidesulfovibrio marinus]
MRPVPGTLRIPALLLALLALALLASACGSSSVRSTPPSQKPGTYSKATQRPYTIKGTTYHPIASADGFTEEGLASWYGHPFHGRKTSCGEIYNMNDMTAAHKILPMGTVVRVRDLSSGRSVDVRINDRGPFVRARIIDLSREAARRLGMLEKGTTRVRVSSLSSLPQLKDGDLQGRFYVQIGSFTVQQNANRLLAQIRSRYPRSRIQYAVVGGMSFWRVQAGTFSSLHAAERQSDMLESSYPQCFVIAE